VGVGGQSRAPAALPPGKTWYPLFRRLSGPQGLSGQVRWEGGGKLDLSVRNGVLLYKQLIRPMMDYACTAWRSSARYHVRRLQVLQSKCPRLATVAPWYVSNRQIHEDLGVPLFADHIRALTASFDSKLADMGNPLLRQLGRYLR